MVIREWFSPNKMFQSVSPKCSHHLHITALSAIDISKLALMTNCMNNSRAINQETNEIKQPSSYHMYYCPNAVRETHIQKWGSTRVANQRIYCVANSGLTELSRCVFL